MARELVYTSRSPEDTRAIAAALANVLRPGDVVALSGDLGAGKTAFVQGAARALGVRAPVTSPTFVIVREYEGERAGIRHVDVYRLNALQELIDLGYEEVFEEDRVLFIEWADAVGGALPGDRFEVDIRVEAPGEDRRIAVRALGTAAARLGKVPAEVAP